MKEDNLLSQPEKGFTKRALNKGGYDPRSVLRWGQMMAISLLEVVKAVERHFGEEGQKICIETLVKVGRQVGKGILEVAEIPKGLSEIETISFLASWVNRNVYASPDVQKIISDKECEFDILWCPHQDIYTARDCRIQRYIVEGILDSFNAKDYNIEVTKLIPMGDDTCRFRIWKKEEGEEDAWKARSRFLAEKEIRERNKMARVRG
ncbi:MAG: L-2-amino-thiazoline-4-carboxylic acid hydrolase [Candidatus Bathyarchaeaceae archaeon]